MAGVETLGSASQSGAVRRALDLSPQARIERVRAQVPLDVEIFLAQARKVGNEKISELAQRMVKSLNEKHPNMEDAVSNALRSLIGSESSPTGKNFLQQTLDLYISGGMKN